MSPLAELLSQEPHGEVGHPSGSERKDEAHEPGREFRLGVSRSANGLRQKQDRKSANQRIKTSARVRIGCVPTSALLPVGPAPTLFAMPSSEGGSASVLATINRQAAGADIEMSAVTIRETRVGSA
jgi:hypothetical protein